MNPHARGCTTGHKPRARGRTIGRRRVAVSKAHAFAREPVEIGRFNDLVAVTTQIAITKIISQHNEDIGRLSTPMKN